MWRDVRRLMLASCMVQRHLANTSKLMKGRHHEYTATLARRQTPRGGSLTHGRELPSLGGATAWLNAPPLSAADLRGHVVLVDFWTYTCINWLCTLPYVRAW